MPFQFPETMPTDATGLTDLRAEAVKAFNELYGGGVEAPSAEAYEQMSYIVDGIKTIDANLTDLNAADERSAQAAEMAAKLTPNTKPEADADDADSETEETEKAEETDTDSEAHANTETVTAAARTNFSQAAGRTNPDAPADKVGFRLTTSAKSYETGIVDTLRVAKEFGDLAHGRAARVLGAGGKTETTLAYLERNIPSDFVASDEASAISAIDRATDESRLPGGSLVAAGGWCAPSETIYEFLPTIAPGDLLSLPEIGVTRGGIKFPKEPDFSTLIDTIGFSQTEAQAQAETEKTCFEIPCDEFEEVRLDAVGLCLTGGILQDKAWPELTKKYVDEAMRLHQHKLSAARINKIAAGSTNVGTITGVFGTAGAVLATVELQVADMRAKHRIPRSQSVEGMAPAWLLSILRADLAYRDEVLPQQVTDQNIIDHFRNLGANLQFVADWQTDKLGGATAATSWPTEVKVALWPAGTWWSAVEPVISLGVTHDSTLLKKNKQIQMFTEDGVAVGKRGPESRIVTIPVKVDGMVGLRGPVAAQ